MLNLDDLEAIARAATPGPWLIGNSQMFGPHAITRDAAGLTQVQDAWICDADAGHPNAAHIATFDPPTVLALITELKSTKEDLEYFRTLPHVSVYTRLTDGEDIYPVDTILDACKPTNQEGSTER